MKNEIKTNNYPFTIAKNYKIYPGSWGSFECNGYL